MHFRRRIKLLYKKSRLIPTKYYFVGAVLLVMAAYMVAFRPQTLVYSYSGNNCDSRLVILPGIFSQAGSSGYEVSTKGGWSIAGKQMAATELCISPLEAPAENSTKTLAYAPWGGWLGRLIYKVEVGEHPRVDAGVLNQPIPVSRDLQLPISEPDVTFSYALGVDGGREAPCEVEDNSLVCDVPALNLRQGSEYAVSLERSFRDSEIEKVIDADVETLSPLTVVKSSIKDGSTVYSKPKSLTIHTDKSLAKAEFSAWRVDGEESIDLEVSTNFEDKKVEVLFSKDLPRRAEIELKAATLEAIDGSTPLDGYNLEFKTSGGPRVTGVNVGSTGLVVGAPIVVTFDQALSEGQDIGELISVSGGVALQERRGSQLLFSTDRAGRCGSVGIKMKPDIESQHGVSGQSAWEYSGRMSCYTVSTIGYSVSGRPINAYHFGSSGPAIVYTGAIHGNEVSTKHLMDRWIQELDANPSKIPSGKRIIVVPVINPDGMAAGTRSNARNIDLNRNFDVSDWQKNVQYPGGKSWPGGGGKKPMSEPETKAIASFIAGLRPELVVSYHSVASYVVSNKHGQANSRAQQYASLSGYRLVAGGEGSFGYHISGTADDYYREKLGVASILIELGSSSYHEFERNQAAMWAMMR